MVTREDVARRAGVSVGTVSNVMNNKPFVKPEYVRRVNRAIAELQYVPDFTAKSLARRKSNHIGVAVYEMTNPYHAEIIEGLEEYAAGQGYMVTTFLLYNKLSQKLDAICERRLDGLVNFMTNDLPERFVNTLQNQHTVLVNFREDNSFMVINDYEKAMLEIMQKLSELGHTRVGYVSTVDEMRFSSDMRGKTFLNNRSKFGFLTDDDLIVYNADYSLRSEQVGYLLAEQLLEKRPDVTAIFATNDLCAIGIMKRLSEKGYSCPKDISVVGCDDISFGCYLTPALCTIGFDKREYGSSIAKAIIDKLSNGEIGYGKIPFEAKAIFRDSIDKARK